MNIKQEKIGEEIKIWFPPFNEWTLQDLVWVLINPTVMEAYNNLTIYKDIKV